MQPMDMTYIHAPAVYDFRERSILFGPVSDMVPSTPIFEMYPLGLVTLSEYLERHGFRARIYNLAALMLNKKSFDVERHLAALDSRMFGIDLHWMPHCHGAIEVARLVKRLHPDVPISFGGFSATIFHEELMAYPFIDYVVRGDSTEEPTRQLVERVTRAARTHTPVGDLSDIPNLTWRDTSGAVHVNPLSWVPDTMNAISADYSYPMKGVLRHHDFASYLPTKGWLSYPVTAALSCRGCDRHCATCGGSAYAFRESFGRRRVAWRDPDLLIRDIEHVQKHVWGPIFVLNDFLQAGPDFAHRFIDGLEGTLKNPIGFEFFGPPEEGDELYQRLDRHLNDWSVEISAETHDDQLRKKFGKGHYTTAELEQTILDALSHPHCTRFDLYFMTGIPHQTKESILETGEYVRHLYDLVGGDPRLVVMTSPMAPFLDVGSMAFDHPDAFGYRLRAKTLDEHRALMVAPSWKHIMNYESVAVSNDDLVEATYQAALDVNAAKGEAGALDEATVTATDQRIRAAREQMRRLDEVLATEDDGRTMEERLAAYRESFAHLSESTVAEKSELNWQFSAKPSHGLHLAGLWLSNEPANLAARLRGQWREASSDFAYPDQTNGAHSPRWNSDGTEAPYSDHPKEGRRVRRYTARVSTGYDRDDSCGKERYMNEQAIDTATGKAAPAEQSTERVKSIFSTIAPEYERFNTVSSFGVHRRWLASLADATPVGPGAVVLDIAGGTGDVAFEIARRRHPARIVCSDLVPEMLAVAEDHYKAGASRGVPVEFVVADAQALPFPDAEFDAVTVAYGIRNMPKREQALSEAVRVLQPGGAFVCLEFSTPTNPVWARLYDWYRRTMVPAWGGLIAGRQNRDDFVYLADSIAAFPDQPTFAALLQSVGFTAVTWTNCTGGIACIHRGFKPL